MNWKMWKTDLDPDPCDWTLSTSTDSVSVTALLCHLCLAAGEFDRENKDIF